MNTRRNIVIGLAAAALAGVATPAAAQEFPARPIRLIVEYPAGTGGDNYLRTLATYMAKDLGQPVVIENRAGGGGLIAAEAVAKSAPDGYTVLAASQSPLIIRPYIARGQQLDAFRDLMPVTQVYNATTLILAHKSFPAQNLQELIAYAKANPGKVFYATSGLGTSHHFTGEALQQMTGIKLTHVPYKGGTGSMQAVMTGEVQVAIGFGGSAVTAINSGNVKVLALVEGKRFMGNTNIPEVSQLVRGFEAPPSWTGLFVAARTPPAIVRRLQAAVAKAQRAPDFPASDGIEAVGSTPEQFATVLRSQYNLIGKLAKSANIQPE
ncbi:MAG TPA: tripartite tricarboxylate transporter substrate binding protein [Ramlibacter sp.]|nr:tripartite tricarboxylate transporter substrate binding protein [Ramlibacter sp.]